MKILSWLLGLVMAVAVIFFGMVMIASETGEVVVLHTDEGGADTTTRLWVVDHDGSQWLRSGGGASGWYQRLLAAPRVELERAGARRAYIAMPQPDMSARVNELMQEKYGWREDVVALLGSRDHALAIRLTPAQ